jgi:hypothetical protein
MIRFLMRAFGFIVLVIVESVGTANAGDTWVVRQDGVGPVKIGMSLSQLNVALHARFALPENKEDQGCFYVNPARRSHIAFMIENRRLVRIDVDGSGIATHEGVQVGDTEDRVRQAYGAELKVEPNAYTGPEGHYLTIRSHSGPYGIRFETENGKVTTFYAGQYDAIQYIEGCQ